MAEGTRRELVARLGAGEQVVVTGSGDLDAFAAAAAACRARSASSGGTAAVAVLVPDGSTALAGMRRRRRAGRRHLRRASSWSSPTSRTCSSASPARRCATDGPGPGRRPDRRQRPAAPAPQPVVPDPGDRRPSGDRHHHQPGLRIGRRVRGHVRHRRRRRLGPGARASCRPSPASDTGLDFEEVDSVAAARAGIEDGDLDAVVVVPEGFAASLAGDDPADVEVLADSDGQVAGDVARAVAGEISARANAGRLAAATASALGEPVPDAATLGAIDLPVTVEAEGTGGDVSPAAYFGPAMGMLLPVPDDRHCGQRPADRRAHRRHRPHPGRPGRRGRPPGRQGPRRRRHRCDVARGDLGGHEPAARRRLGRPRRRPAC